MKSEIKSKRGSPAQFEPAPSEGAGIMLTVHDVAEILKVPVSWVYVRTRDHSPDRIPGYRLGKYWRFREAEVRAWLERHKS